MPSSFGSLNDMGGGAVHAVTNTRARAANKATGFTLDLVFATNNGNPDWLFVVFHYIGSGRKMPSNILGMV